MNMVNVVVSAVLRSPLHGLLSGSTDLVRYTGRRSGKQFTTPTQYVRDRNGVVILVGSPEAKGWWKNFRDERDVELLIGRRWMPMTARALVGADEPAAVAPLLDAYLRRFPRAARAFGADTGESRARRAVVVWCQPR
jgi:deazaflavin-dependent oxidoreductase (nitroreductase family)